MAIVMSHQGNDQKLGRLEVMAEVRVRFVLKIEGSMGWKGSQFGHQLWLRVGEGAVGPSQPRAASEPGRRRRRRRVRGGLPMQGSLGKVCSNNRRRGAIL